MAIVWKKDLVNETNERPEGKLRTKSLKRNSKECSNSVQGCEPQGVVWYNSVMTVFTNGTPLPRAVEVVQVEAEDGSSASLSQQAGGLMSDETSVVQRLPLLKAGQQLSVNLRVRRFAVEHEKEGGIPFGCR